jgi:hypothetical protein
MDAKLREFLARHGVSEEALDALERGDAPSSDVLRKSDDPVERLRKIAPDSPALTKIREIDDMLHGVNGVVAQINETLAAIMKADAARGAFARGEALFKAGKVNGTAHALADALLNKGEQTP